MVLGSYGSGVSIAAATTFGDAGVPAIGVTCTNPQVTQVSDTYYRICFIDPFQGTVRELRKEPRRDQGLLPRQAGRRLLRRPGELLRRSLRR